MGKKRASTEQMFEDFFGFKKKPDLPPPPPPKPSGPPSNRKPAVHMECGHFQVQSLPRPGEDAYRMRGPTQISVFVETPDECHYCRMGVPGNPQYQRGSYCKPVPFYLRRTQESEAMGRYGYCCDDDGYYIGGLANNGRYYSPDDRRCEVHRATR